MILIELHNVEPGKGLRDSIYIPPFTGVQVEVQNSDLPEGCLRAGVVLHFHWSLFQCSVFISRPKQLLGAQLTVGKRCIPYTHCFQFLRILLYPNIAP